MLVYPKVVLYRLSWQRVWMITPVAASVTAIAWRPDGRGELEGEGHNQMGGVSEGGEMGWRGDQPLCPL